MKKVLSFLKKEVVLSVATVLAVFSAFLIPPDKAYLGYVDFRTLALLFCLMSVMAGLQRLGVFRWIARALLAKVGTGCIRVILVLVFLCFFFGMLITNDVALLTFVPFTFTVLELLGEEAKDRLLIPVVVLETLGANLGSMLTPVGNPQNLYLFGKAGMDLPAFLGLMAFYTCLSGVLLVVWSIVVGKRHGMRKAEAGDSVSTREKERTAALEKHADHEHMDRAARELLERGRMSNARHNMLLVLYALLFLLALLTVARIVPFYVTLAVTLGAVLLFDGKTLLSVDYSLLLTFVAFFVFIGNMGRVPAFSQFLAQAIQGREVPVAILASQVISNVPAALLLSGFTGNIRALIIGVNLGGLGTLIASMASLISYKYVAKLTPQKKGRYFLYFTVTNLIFLAILLLGHYGLTLLVRS